MAESAVIRVLIIDDHLTVRAGLAALIEMQSDMEVVGQGSNGIEAFELFENLLPDVTLMDLKMPEADGVTAIGRIREKHDSARVIVLTTYDGDVDIFRALHAGAKGYLLKDAPHQDLFEAIRSVHSGRMHVAPDAAAKLAEYFTMPSLTERELEVLNLMATGDANIQIANTLSVAESTVKTHIGSIFSKLGVSDRIEAVVVAAKRGIIHLS